VVEAVLKKHAMAKHYGPASKAVTVAQEEECQAVDALIAKEGQTK
jgi:hypothetical protein